MRALVTGGTGFIGSRIVEALVSGGHKVRIFSHSGSSYKHENVEVASGDLREPSSVIEALHGTEVIYHAGEIRNTSRRAAERNLEAAKTIVNHCREAGLRRFVFVSSISVAGIPAKVPADESTTATTELSDHYTNYKREAEEFLRQAAGIEVSIVRPAPVCGRGSRVLPGVIRNLKRFSAIGLPFPGDGRNLMTLIHVGDLGRAIAKAGTVDGAAGETFNLTDGIYHTWRNFLEEIHRVWGRKLRLISVPPGLVRPPAFAIDLLAWPFGISADIQNFVTYLSKDVFFDNRKARETLDWEPEFDLRTAVKDMLGDPAI